MNTQQHFLHKNIS